MTVTYSLNHPTPFFPFTLTHPTHGELPLLADSPHSGVKYPEDFKFSIPFEALRMAEDTDVHRLWESIPSMGGTLLEAEFPRSYIDTNRNINDIDIEMLSHYWSKEARPTQRSHHGVGLIFKNVSYEDDVLPIYDRHLTPQEVQKRIETYYLPYHHALREQANALHQKFGVLWHLNLHSMPTGTYESRCTGEAAELPDFVLGDLNGTTCAPELMQVVTHALKECGYSVAANKPYKGAALIASIGNPEKHYNSLQIEVHRRLYMDEKTRQRSAGFQTLQANLKQVLAQIVSYIQSEL